LKNGLSTAGAQLLSRLLHRLEHHPKQATALIAALLLGGGGAAFAVASLQPEPVDVTVRQVLEAVQPLPIADQVQALDAHTFNLFRTETTRSSDTVETLLARLGLDDLAAAAYLRNEPLFRSELLGRAGRNVTAEATDKHGLLKLSARWAPTDDGTFKRLVIQRAPDGRFASRLETAPLVAATRMSSATIRSSLFGAADKARIPDKIVAQIIDIFSGDIDFHRALHSGDRFSVVYEALEADGEPMSTGRVLSVQFVNRGQTHEAMWFQEPGTKGGYYTLDGKSVDTSYLASPVEFSRVTSGFAMRLHPILHRWKAHLGVDYGGEIGTPVRSVGDGVVEFAGEQNGFGNVVIVRHNTTDETVYAHLSRIDVRPGRSVAQGQTVGAIGQTGWATGPHLHFEFRVNGVHRNPSAIARSGKPATLSAASKPQFDRLARAIRLQFQAASESAVTASAE
jgi:murein DD-endopeptidase MepM/ murein hydrolase activator NlpD